ncbi:MAG: zinc-dependent alcohol dehydrogenase family protein [Oscillospiraceae bacterium]|jgi:2-desacetyl-2-hydroxyethyl bacteriochlorophyllide A dehydrogenase|nr:zinc-dependent alcohol dehydrogenase family protein [Oscillospiraceae bacterium]
MKAVYFLGDKKLEVREQQMPQLKADEMMIRIAACGVCGTDIHIISGDSGPAAVNPPVVLGHEYAGEVEQVGAQVTAFKKGDHVAVDPNIYCGTCHYCKNGKKQLCEDMKAFGVTRDGGFAEYCIIPMSQAYLLNPDLDIEAGAMAEPLACCIHGIDLAGIKVGDNVLIIGGGAIGLLMVQLAKLSGAAHVILSEPVEMRRKTALELGADGAFDPLSCIPAEQLKALTGREFADVIIECAGNNFAVKNAFDCAAKGATILLFSVPVQDAVYDMPLFDIFKKELTIKGSFVNPDTHARAVELINTGKVNVAPIITHRFGINDLEKAIKCQKSTESIKCILKLI